MDAPAGIVLAAGRSTRMGRSKVLEQIGGRSLVAHALAALAGAAERIVVAPPGGLPEGSVRGAVCVENPDPDRGMLSSVAVGLIAAGRPWALVLPVDCPLVAPETAALLVARCRGTRGCAAAVPVFRGRSGHPVLLGPEVAQAVVRAVEASEQTDLLRLLQAFSERVVRVPVDDPAVLDNVNTPADLEAVRARRAVAT